MAEGGIKINETVFALPGGAQQLGLAAFLAVVLVLRPDGLIRGHEIKGWGGGFRAFPGRCVKATAN